MDLSPIVRPFYEQALTVAPGGDPAAVLGALLADDFRSENAQEVKSKPALIGQVGYFWKLIPDLRWEIQETLQDGNRVVVRSIATGTPNGDFMGLSTNGTRSFRIMTIDIHTVVDGRVTQVWHLEDWATAMRQLRG
jgi:predicted ester cyclase